MAKSSHNIGEGALIAGLHHSLKSDFPDKNFSFTCIDRKYFQSVHGSEFQDGSTSLRFDLSFVEYLNNNYDLLILGGGGILQSGEYENLGGLVIAGDMSALKKLTIPWVVYAAGDNRFSPELPFNYKSEFANLVEIAQDTGLGIVSLRNDLSYQRFSNIFPDSVMKNVVKIADPGLYIPPTILYSPPPIPRRIYNISLQLAGDRINQRIPHTDTAKDPLEIFFQSLANCLLELNSVLPIQVTLVPHIPADFHLISKFIIFCESLKINNSSMVRELFQFHKCTKGYLNASEFFSIYTQSDLAIGMRGHSGICSTGLRTPFINIQSHPKTHGFFTEMNLDSFSLDPLAPSFSDDLFKLSRTLLGNSSQWYKIRDNSYRIEQSRTLDFHSRILGKIP